MNKSKKADNERVRVPWNNAIRAFCILPLCISYLIPSSYSHGEAKRIIFSTHSMYECSTS